MENVNLQATAPISGVAYLRNGSPPTPGTDILEFQRRQIEARAAQDGVKLIRFYSDNPQRHFPRTGLAHLLADVQMGNFSVVYVETLYRIDRRLARVVRVVQQLCQVGVSLVTVRENFDLRSPETQGLFFAAVALNEQFSALPSRKPTRQSARTGSLPFKTGVQ
ncbi:MAG: recombinase family protein [Chloroflexota bacterium]